jgi:hypothetical protein
VHEPGSTVAQQATYTAFVQSVDAFVHRHQSGAGDEMLVVVAAGNDGSLSYEGSVTDPATAKNVLAVGATASSAASWRQRSFSQGYGV